MFHHDYGNVTSSIKSCNIYNVTLQCGENERCFQNSKNDTGECVCNLGYKRENEKCVQFATTVAVVTSDPPDAQESSGGGSVAAGLLIPTFLVVVSVLLYFVARRYKLLQRVRQLRPNRYGNVLVTRDDDDDDDPPIA
ncbi:uncharacterized protein LOC108627931 isoform X2 [Ceratina calcarata]|uniref:Uncharacterized protein LOC108627931 isoform X2 n=1 Tax=Ceratina calcarata TaxID=156304 RepID=A0AAJ7WCN6_9HYME|nr:uncharacterized protein LOC108627931 isoform X2 [Ceratina calcarata]